MAREHHTKNKSDLALAQAVAALTALGYDISIPLSEHLPYDIIADTGKRLVRIQVKHSADGTIRNATSYATKAGNHEVRYQDGDFEYYALYLPDVQRVVFPAFHFGGRRIKFVAPKNGNKFLWYEDFLDLTDEAPEWSHKTFKGRCAGIGQSGAVC